MKQNEVYETNMERCTRRPVLSFFRILLKDLRVFSLHSVSCQKILNQKSRGLDKIVSRAVCIASCLFQIPQVVWALLLPDG